MSVESLARLVERKARRNVVVASRHLQVAAKKQFGKKAYPPASTPGEYPALRTGDLTESVTVEFENGGLASSVGPTMYYEKYLRGSGRKMMGDVYEEEMPVVARLLVRG